jgi:exopolysaccharide/PEP-CTERM locus tyrosine autokinase
MGIVEQAALRLEQLRQAGVEAASDAVHEPPRRPPAARAAPPTPGVQTTSTRPPVRIDLARLAACGYVTPEVPHSRVAAEFRMIKRTLLANAAADRNPAIAAGNRIMVTSSVPGEGKTFAAVNLAMSIAMELDHKVLLVDADVARPTVPELLGVPAGPGLLDKLAKPGADVRDFIVRTNVDKLEFMTSGSPRPHATEMLSSEAMSALVEELGARHPERVVLFDSPPLLATTEAAALARHMGQIVFVVAAGSTMAADVRRALPMIESCPVRLLMLNKLSPRGHDLQGYGYTSGYGA